MVPVYDQENEIVTALWLFDSGGYDCEGSTTSYGCVNQVQIDWYEKISAEIGLNNKNYLSFAFQHIPPIEMMW